MTIQTFLFNSCFAIWRFWAQVITFLFYPIMRWFIVSRSRKFRLNFNGPEPYHIQILKEKQFYTKLIVDGTLGFAEGYIDKLWTVEDLPGAIGHAFRYGGAKDLMHPLGFLYTWVNLQTQGDDSEAVAKEHYDYGNDWFEGFMGPNMQYTCGYWKTAKDLETAQFDKMELIAKKLQLKPGMRVCDFGCGWGTLAVHLAKHHGVSVVGVTNSVEQAKYVNERIGGLPIEVRVCDYRDMKETGGFDRITAVGFTEHIGPNNYKTLYKIFNKCLKDDGLALVQTITRNVERFPHGNEPFCHKYIFKNGYAPSHLEIATAVHEVLTIQDWDSFGDYYATTLDAWREKFHSAWPGLQKKHNYDDKVFRIWDYYFAAGIALFAERQHTLCQIVFSKAGMLTGRNYLRDPNM